MFREDYEDGLHREFEIVTQSVDVWHVSEYSRHRVDRSSHGQFHDKDAYVVRWHYLVTQSRKTDIFSLLWPSFSLSPF